jgi:hypothetical protein
MASAKKRRKQAKLAPPKPRPAGPFRHPDVAGQLGSRRRTLFRQLERIRRQLLGRINRRGAADGVS